jgi:hypothetical protein
VTAVRGKSQNFIAKVINSIESTLVRISPRRQFSSKMAKKRKAGGRPAKQNSAQETERTKFAFEERFDDSEDEFQAGRDHILLEEAPEAKRRRKMAEQGLSE